jgi:hypothetical protein
VIIYFFNENKHLQQNIIHQKIRKIHIYYWQTKLQEGGSPYLCVKIIQMIIANPIYDVVFKLLMSNTRIAKFFIGTILGQTVTDLAFSSQEMAYNRDTTGASGISPAIFRLDFVATIKTNSGENLKVLIEIQKSWRYADIMRFRNYLGQQYGKSEIVSTPLGNREVPLPIVTIYLLGFELHIAAAALRIGKTYYDLQREQVVAEKDEFAELLTHECYIIQIPRLNGRFQEKLDRLLTVFEQKNIVDSNRFIKEYDYPVEDEEIDLMIKLLHNASSNPETRKNMEAEQEAYRVFYAAASQIEFEYSQKLVEKQQIINEKIQIIEEKDQIIAAKQKALADVQKANSQLLLDRKDLVVKLHSEGFSVDKIALFIGLPVTIVEQILNAEAQR